MKAEESVLAKDISEGNEIFKISYALIALNK